MTRDLLPASSRWRRSTRLDHLESQLKPYQDYDPFEIDVSKYGKSQDELSLMVFAAILLKEDVPFDVVHHWDLQKAVQASLEEPKAAYDDEGAAEGFRPEQVGGASGSADGPPTCSRGGRKKPERRAKEARETLLRCQKRGGKRGQGNCPHPQSPKRQACASQAHKQAQSQGR